eukprot:3316765-Rhodomonas_salina.3
MKLRVGHSTLTSEDSPSLGVRYSQPTATRSGPRAAAPKKIGGQPKNRPGHFDLGEIDIDLRLLE